MANILLVDDQPANLLALEAILEPLGQRLVTARSGEEALRLLLHDDFAVVLLDVQMEGIDGFEVARLIRGRERSRHTPIIFITAYEQPEFSAARAYTLGAVDYLVKPLVPAILRAKVDVFVQLSRHAEQLKQLEATRLAEAALRASERRLRALLVNAWDGISLVAPDGTVLETIPDTPRRLGYTREEFVGRNPVELVHPEDLPAVQHALAELLRAPGAQATLQYRLRRKDGSWAWVEGKGANLLHDPAVGAIVVNYRNISQQRQAEEVRSRLAAIVESSGDAIIGEDLDGTITTWNAGAERLYGYRADEVLGRPVSVLMPAGQADELPATLDKLRRGERIDHYETVGLRKDGMPVPVSLSISPIRDAHGAVVGAAKIARDITERKRLEGELEARATQLAEANRQKDEFLAMLAHELRNPLAPLRTGLHILRLPQTPAAAREKTHDMLERQVRHLTRLVDDLLDVSRLTRGKVQLRPERLDLGRLVRITAEDRRATLEQAGLALVVEAPETPVWVLGDPTRLAQILTNLLDNAVKFSGGRGHVFLRVATDPQQSRAILSVRDEGIGIEPAVLPRVFDVFAQADHSLDRSRGGLGLGLALVRGLAELHGGEVEASSAGPGRGAEFTVRLPLEGEPPALSESPTAPTRKGKPQRVLVVEDSPDAAESLRMLLELLGHKVGVAYTGPQGVQAAKDWRPDVVVCDIGLPGLDGYGVARELRRNPMTAQVRLLAVSGYGSEEDRQRSRQAGFDHHLVKPADPGELQRLLAWG
jgi:PAS domain S-box-containing protein